MRSNVRTLSEVLEDVRQIIFITEMFANTPEEPFKTRAIISQIKAIIVPALARLNELEAE